MNVMFEEIEYPNKSTCTSKKTPKLHTDIHEHHLFMGERNSFIFLQGFI